MLKFFANLFLWLSNIIFFISILPQLFLNFKLKTTKGLSDIFILLSFFGTLSYWLYAIKSDLPSVYYIMANLNLLAFLILVYQKIYYSPYSFDPKVILREHFMRSPRVSADLSATALATEEAFGRGPDVSRGAQKNFVFLSLGLLFIGSLFISLKTKTIISFWGYLPILISFSKKFPQMLKNHRTKSVFGFSIAFVIINFIGYLMELFGVLVLNLQKPILLNDLKGILISSVFIWQYFVYRK